MYGVGYGSVLSIGSIMGKNMRRRMWGLVLWVMGCMPVSMGYGQIFYPFHLGDHAVEDTTVRFEFPDERIPALYAFNFSVYPALGEKRNRARIRVFDQEKNLLAEGKSICIKARPGAKFGSIVFPHITRATVDEAAFFTLQTVPCEESTKHISAAENPQLRPLSAAVTAIARILFPCLETGESESACICKNIDKLRAPVRRAAAFLRDHPELQGKDLVLHESMTATDHGRESLTLSICLDDVARYLDAVRGCE